jgi:uncharacterized protein (TIGR02271 family)
MINKETFYIPKNMVWSHTMEHSVIQHPVEPRTEIKIPLKREEVQVTKQPYVKEEIVVKKKPVNEIRQVSELVRSEKVNTDDKNVKVEEQEKEV